MVTIRKNWEGTTPPNDQVGSFSNGIQDLHHNNRLVHDDEKKAKSSKELSKLSDELSKK